MRKRLRIAIAALLLGLGFQGQANPPPPQGFLAQFEWPLTDDLAGGFSSLDMAADGASFALLTDRGAYTHGQITRDAAGAITNVTLLPFALLRGLGDKPLAGGRNDSEGLAIAPDGTAYVSFEGVARVLRYARLDGPAENLPEHPDFAGLQTNSALEALAVDGAGTLYTIPERSGGETRPFTIYRFRNGAWDSDLSLPRSPGFLPVAADFGPEGDGRLYILERQFNGLAGFASRLARYAVTPTALGPPEVLMQSETGFHDNLEGLSIWRDAAGALRATMVADNNFLPILSSGLVEYRLPD